jgi:hypothetical protein
MGLGKHRSTFSGRRALFAAAVLAGLVAVPMAGAHVERASYWPDPAADNAGGVPAGGAVPEVRSLFSALDDSARGDTRIVCQGGEAVPYRAPGAIVQSRQSVEISRARVNRLERKQKDLRAKGKWRKAAKVKKKLTKAKKRYRAALAAEEALRKQAGDDYQRRLNEELAAQADYKQDLLAEPSMQALDQSLQDAVANGYVIRPSEGSEPFSQAEADQLWEFNAQLLARCEYDEIQPAITDSGNNDRVVVMPGLYTEPTSRSKPTNDPSCDQYEEVNDRPGDGEGGFQTGANTYTYIYYCPNDQNLIAILGREPRHELLPPTPLDDRHGIPDLGPCIRCNLQLEGSGVSADDVVVEAGDPARGDGQDPDPENDNKDVGIRIDRADGSVLRQITVRHVREHGLYHHEVDGYVAERFKVHYAHEYGTLEFTSDHGVIRDCDTDGSGDAGIYPGSAPDTGEQGVAEQGIEQRYNTEITRCDMHHNAAGYSGTAANAVWLHNNDFYDNALGFTTDVFTAAGHPGFPQDSDLLENNEFYDNNFNPYLEECEGPSPSDNYDPENPTCSDIDPTIPVPVGTGMWIAGGNNNEVRNNHFWDNWRRGAMLFTVPDAFVCGDASPTNPGNQQHGCDETEVNTSYRNEFYGNVMGRTPGDVADPNGVDFWWDRFPGTQPPPNGNCWYDNVGMDGTRDTLTAEPPVGPVPDTSVPGFLPEDCSTSIGTSGASAEAELLGCLAQFDQGVPAGCTWFTTPPEP